MLRPERAAGWYPLSSAFSFCSLPFVVTPWRQEFQMPLAAEGRRVLSPEWSLGWVPCPFTEDSEPPISLSWRSLSPPLSDKLLASAFLVDLVRRSEDRVAISCASSSLCVSFVWVVSFALVFAGCCFGSPKTKGRAVAFSLGFSGNTTIVRMCLNTPLSSGRTKGMDNFSRSLL